MSISPSAKFVRQTWPNETKDDTTGEGMASVMGNFPLLPVPSEWMRLSVDGTLVSWVSVPDKSTIQTPGGIALRVVPDKSKKLKERFLCGTALDRSET